MQNIGGKWQFKVYQKDYFGNATKYIGLILAMGLSNIDAMLNAKKLAQEKYNLKYRDIVLF